MENIFCLESHIHLCSRHTSANPAYVIKTCLTWHAFSGTRYWGLVSPKLHVSTYRNQQHCWWFHYTYLTCLNFVCQHSVMVETTLKPRAFAFIVSYFPTCIGKPGAIFSAHVNIRQTSSVVIPGFRQTVFALRRSWHSKRFDCFPSDPFEFMPLSVACVASKVCHLGDCADRLAHARHASLQPVLLSSSLSMHSGEIYLRLKPYLVVELSPDIVTEHCYQVCVLSMMFCRSDCWQCAGMVSDCAIRKLVGETCGLT